MHKIDMNKKPNKRPLFRLKDAMLYNHAKFVESVRKFSSPGYSGLREGRKEHYEAHRAIKRDRVRV